jgi:hypothetical protein
MRLILAALLLAAPAAAQTMPAPGTALAQDAAEYARQHRVAPEEAARRLAAQEETGAVTERLRETYARRLAGLFVEHEPGYRIVVLLKGGRAVPDEAVEAGGMIVPIVFRTGAPATRARVLGAIETRGERLRAAFPAARGMAADPRTGTLLLMLGDLGSDEARIEAAERARRIAGVPVTIRLVDRSADAAVEGGARVEGTDAVSGRRAVCTAGFVVSDGARTGLLTAAHCPDLLTYREPGGATAALPFVGQWGWRFQDVQVNAIEGPAEPLFYADAAKSAARRPAAVRSRAATRAGDFVCHRGERSGYSCGDIELTDFAPPGTLCGGPCAATWVTVSGPGCGGGDSGGPVFAGTIAYGIMKGATWGKGGRCAFYYYMSLDYLPDGWRVVTEDSAAAMPAAEPEPDLPPAGYSGP